MTEPIPQDKRVEGGSELIRCETPSCREQQAMAADQQYRMHFSAVDQELSEWFSLAKSIYIEARTIEEGEVVGKDISKVPAVLLDRAYSKEHPYDPSLTQHGRLTTLVVDLSEGLEVDPRHCLPSYLVISNDLLETEFASNWKWLLTSLFAVYPSGSIWELEQATHLIDRSKKRLSDKTGMPTSGVFVTTSLEERKIILDIRSGESIIMPQRLPLLSRYNLVGNLPQDTLRQQLAQIDRLTRAIMGFSHVDVLFPSE